MSYTENLLERHESTFGDMYTELSRRSTRQRSDKSALRSEQQQIILVCEGLIEEKKLQSTIIQTAMLSKVRGSYGRAVIGPEHQSGRLASLLCLSS